MLETHRKIISLLHRARNDEFEFPSPHQETHLIGTARDDAHGSGFTRDPSPELVRISPLVTRPPKQKPSSKYFVEFMILR